MAGNATISLYYNGKLTSFDLWLNVFSTSSSLEFTSQQVRDGIQWIPIRRQQMMVNFNALWPLMSNKNSYNLNMAGFEGIDQTDGFAKLNRFQDAVRGHQLAIAKGATMAPMTLTYHNNSDKTSSIYNPLISRDPLEPLIYEGWIQSVEKQYVRFQNMFMTQYQMNVLTNNVSNTSLTAAANGFNFSYAPDLYTPTAADQNNYGGSWLNIGTLAQGTLATISGVVPG